MAALAATVVAAAATASFVPAGVPADRGRDSGTASRTTYVDAGQRFSVTYPAGWRRASRRLTPVLSDPREILSVGNGRLPVQRAGADCAQLPSGALRALRAGQALVTIQEASRPSGGAPKRPARWGWTTTRRDRIECVPAEVDARWLVFQDRGRGFYALVAIGPGSSVADGRRAMAVLNSFRPARR